MCLAVPVQLVEVNEEMGVVDISGTRRDVDLRIVEDPQPGDYVLLHAGFAIQKIDPEEAEKTLRIWDEMADLGI